LLRLLSLKFTKYVKDPLWLQGPIVVMRHHTVNQDNIFIDILINN